MSDQQPEPADADVVLAALKNMGSGNYATLATATGLSKIAISSAITDLTKRGLVTSQSGNYSPTDGTPPAPAVSKSTRAKAAQTEEPTPPPPPAVSRKKPQPASKPAASDSEVDSDVVLAALKNMGSGNYATLATATGLSKIAISSAITDLTKRGLVTSQSGNYSPTDGTPPNPAASKPSAAISSSASLVNELEKLAALRDSGALTAAEFTKAKKKLLDID